jgi:hypothetical protein
MVDIKIDTTFADRAKKIIKKYPNRAIDLLHCFSTSQRISKEWLIEQLNRHTPNSYTKRYIDVAILGSWYGYLSHLLKEHFKCKLITEIRCYDVDDTAKKIGRMMFSDDKNLRFMTRNIDDVDFSQQGFDIIINTSCEHMQDDVINRWLDSTRKDVICVLQSTDKPDTDHINCSKDTHDFVNRFKHHFSECSVSEYCFENYSRFLIVGKKK